MDDSWLPASALAAKQKRDEAELTRLRAELERVTRDLANAQADVSDARAAQADAEQDAEKAGAELERVMTERDEAEAITLSFKKERDAARAELERLNASLKMTVAQFRSEVEEETREACAKAADREPCHCGEILDRRVRCAACRLAADIRAIDLNPPKEPTP